jgi:IS5 family transposase
VEQVADLLHGQEKQVWADSDFWGAPSRVSGEDLQSQIAARLNDFATLPERRANTTVQNAEHRNFCIRTKVQQPFCVIRRRLGLVKVRFRSLAKNTAHVVTLFAMSNVWLWATHLMAATAAARPPAT